MTVLGVGRRVILSVLERGRLFHLFFPRSAHARPPRPSPAPALCVQSARDSALPEPSVAFIPAAGAGVGWQGGRGALADEGLRHPLLCVQHFCSALFLSGSSFA